MSDETAVAVADQKSLDTFELPGRQLLSQTSLSSNVERIEQTVVLPAVFQYAINRWQQTPKVGITSDGYDYLNRAMSVQLYQPTAVNDENGNRARNPIHRRDYIYLRMVGIWYNDVGSMMSYQEDVEVDYQLVYHDARINSKSAKIKMNEATGEPMVNDGGTPIVSLSMDDELRALKALSQLRTFGMRYAQTVAKTRILKVACGIRTLPINSPRDFKIRVVGYRDKLTPDQRIEEAKSAFGRMFGQGVVLDDKAALSDEELGDLRETLDDGTEDIERSIVSSYQPNQQPEYEIQEQPETRSNVKQVNSVEDQDPDGDVSTRRRK